MRAISSIITAHNEGQIVTQAVNSVLENLKFANLNEFEILIGLDSPDQETKRIIEKLSENNKRIKKFDFQVKDVGFIRQELLNQSKFDYVSFLDGDDIWGDNWIYQVRQFCLKNKNAVFHPQLTIFFDDKLQFVMKNPDSTSKKFNKEILIFENVWSSSFVTPRWIMEKFPMKSGRTFDDLSPYAYEDWSWFREILTEGIEHRVINKTVHFHRIKTNSNTTRSILSKKQPWPIDIRKLLY